MSTDINPMNNYLGATKIMTPEIKIPVLKNEVAQPLKRTRSQKSHKKSQRHSMKNKAKKRKPHSKKVRKVPTRYSKKRENNLKKEHMEQHHLLQEINNRLKNIEQSIHLISSRPIEVKLEKEQDDQLHNHLEHQKLKHEHQINKYENKLREHEEQLKEHEDKLKEPELKEENQPTLDEVLKPIEVTPQMIHHVPKKSKCGMHNENIHQPSLHNLHELNKQNIENENMEKNYNENKPDINELMKIISNLDKETPENQNEPKHNVNTMPNIMSSIIPLR